MSTKFFSSLSNLRHGEDADIFLFFGIFRVQLECIKSNNVQLRMENAVLEEQNKELTEKEQQQSQRLLAVTELNRARHDEEEESAKMVMMETMAKMERQKNEFESLIKEQKRKLIASEQRGDALSEQLVDSESEQKSLRKQLKTQKKLYSELKVSAKKLEDELATKKDLMERVADQKAFITRLQAENQDLLATKEQDDKQLFQELEYLRNKSIVTKVGWCHVVMHVACLVVS